MQHKPIQYNTAQYNTTRYDTIRYDTIQDIMIGYKLYNINNKLYDTIQSNTSYTSWNREITIQRAPACRAP